MRLPTPPDGVTRRFREVHACQSCDGGRTWPDPFGGDRYDCELCAGTGSISDVTAYPPSGARAVFEALGDELAAVERRCVALAGAPITVWWTVDADAREISVTRIYPGTGVHVSVPRGSVPTPCPPPSSPKA